jgi:hypothetical protein
VAINTALHQQRRNIPEANMECLCDMLPYPHPAQAHAFYQQQLAQHQAQQIQHAQQQQHHQQQQQLYAAYVQPQQHLEEQYLHYGGPEFADFGYAAGGFYEEYEEAGEPSTRPRLTKEQVEVLESQFQQNHKPSSVVKRQLAMQTMLSLPRVAVRVSVFYLIDLTLLTCAELVSEPKSKSEAAEETGGAGKQYGPGRSRACLHP